MKAKPKQVVSRHLVRGGAPCYEGTRIPVSAVQAWLIGGCTVQRILRAFPDLTIADVEAARTYPLAHEWLDALGDG